MCFNHVLCFKRICTQICLHWVRSTTRIPVKNIYLNSNFPGFSEQYFVSSSPGLTAVPPASSRTPLLILDSAHNQRNYSFQITQNRWVREKTTSTYHSIRGDRGRLTVYFQTNCMLDRELGSRLLHDKTEPRI